MLGISVYLGNKEIADQKSYIRKMNDCGFRCIFTSLHIPEEDNSKYKDQLKELGHLATQLDMELMADISPDSLNLLGMNWSNADKLLRWGLTGIRVDYGIPEPVIIELSQKMKVALNASTITEEALTRMKANGLVTASVEAWHNFYPRPETGLDLDDFIEKNRWLKEKGITIMTFIPGDEELRGPLYQTLPTIEDHRKQSPFASYMEMKMVGRVDKILIGDVAISSSTLDQFTSYNKNNEILLKAEPDENSAEEILQKIPVLHTNRPDGARDCFRSVESRQYPHKNISPSNCMERPIGTITIDNKKYLRYQGEIQITKRDLPADEKVNVVGRVVSKDRPLLKWIRDNQKVRIQWGS
ncbi:DUF871 domain-containing protein [Virgibacillus alimentarius]|uniref:DUF871 domain-containing protein n=1 Tax=Virgibacillus alimentarius TaxID=698769 RepID=UPI00049335B5|nr:MupG family TIM beta-alpha barrel fold protein [Virgibacillus alimentarius]